MNEQSSRSHTILRLGIESTHGSTKLFSVLVRAP
jgi:hypothetical protein